MIYRFCRFLKHTFFNPVKTLLGYKKQFFDLKKYINVRELKPATGDLRKLQLQFLEFAKEINQELVAQNIYPFLYYGSLIGAERHSGFIPWDDDFDFGLMREDYTKLIQLAKQKYIYIKYPYNRFASFKSIFEFKNELFKKYPNQLIFLQKIDAIHLLKGTSINDFAKVDFFVFDYYRDDYKISSFKAYAKKLYKKLENINNYNKEIDILSKEVKKSKYIESVSHHIGYGIDNASTHSTEIDGATEFFLDIDFFPLKKMKFEDTEFFTPQNHKKLIESCYGASWNQIPDDVSSSYYETVQKMRKII